jgi:hypothetical protein
VPYRKKHIIVNISFTDQTAECHDGWKGTIDEYDIHRQTPEILAPEVKNMWREYFSTTAKRRFVEDSF